VNTWKVILATLAIFGAGMVTGNLLQEHGVRLGCFAKPHAPPPPRPVHPLSARGLRFDFLRHLQNQLGVTPEQRQRIDAIITQSQERTKELMKPVVPQLRKEVERAKAEFRAVLTPQQRERLDQLVKRYRVHERHWLKRHSSTQVPPKQGH
jgi:Spy/CpxP family protein refolding chaperone